MDLYGAGVSISQANGLSREARSLAHQSRDFNGQLAANIDEVKNQKDQEGLEQQAINMYKGGTAAHSFAASDEGKKVLKGLKGGIQRGGQFLPVSFKEKFAVELANSGSVPAKTRVASSTRDAMRSGAAAVGGTGAEALEDVPLGLPARPAEGFLGARTSGLIEDLPGGLEEVGAETAEETFAAASNPLSSSSLGGFVRDASAPGGIRADIGALDDSVDFGGLTPTNDAREALEASRPEQAASSVEGAAEPLIETSAQAERTGQFADVGRRAGVVEETAQAVQEGVGTSEKAAAELLAKKEGKDLLKKAGTKLGIAGLGGGLEIYKDIQRGSIGNNWEQQVGNVGNIIGSGLEIAGVLGMAIPGVGIGLEAIGAGISLGATALETAGDVRDSAESTAKETASLSAQGKGIGSAQQITTAVARTQ
tara:strand:+ start:5647 stop:6918 length:1272 start_codon:yes stop_codon:yes gene_type:complete